MKRIPLFINKHFKKIKEEYQKKFIVSFGIFLIALIVIFIVFNQFVTAINEKKEIESNLMKKQLEYRYSLLNHKENFEKELENLENNWKFMKNRVFIDSSNDLTFSRIQQIINEMANTRNVTVKSYKFEEAKEIENFYILPVSLEISAKYEDLVSILYAIENYNIYLKISHLELMSFYENEKLNVRMVVEGYRYYEK
jgi:Tfp pilus assembly protein PilO